MHSLGESTWQGDSGCRDPGRHEPHSPLPFTHPCPHSGLGGGQQSPLALTGDSLSASSGICGTRLTCRVSTETPQHHSNCRTVRNVV